jgi:hypothetical protein
MLQLSNDSKKTRISLAMKAGLNKEIIIRRVIRKKWQAKPES